MNRLITDGLNRENPGQGTRNELFVRNLRVLRETNPRLAGLIELTIPEPEWAVHQSQTGLPICSFNNHFLHSSDPIAEGEDFVRRLGIGGMQVRVAIFGFGFGYHIEPLVRLGLSPIVFEPSLSALHLALTNRDLTQLLPHVILHAGPRPPDIAQRTITAVHEPSGLLHPQALQQFAARVPEQLPYTEHDLDMGIRCSTYRNVICLKNPNDMAVYQMLLHQVRPTVVVEIGTCRGGSAMFFADVLKQIGGDRRVYTFDVHDMVAPEVYTYDNIFVTMGGWEKFDPSVIRKDDRVLVIEDSSHTYENSIAVMNAFAQYVTPNSYLIVEDGAAGYSRPEFNGGAIRAIEEFLPLHREFSVDSYWESFYGKDVSNCLRGYLRRLP